MQNPKPCLLRNLPGMIYSCVLLFVPRQEGSSRVQQMARPVTPVEMHKHKGKKKIQKHAAPPPEPNQSQSSPPKNKLLQNPHLADAEKGSDNAQLNVDGGFNMKIRHK